MGETGFNSPAVREIATQWSPADNVLETAAEVRKRKQRKN